MPSEVAPASSRHIGGADRIAPDRNAYDNTLYGLTKGFNSLYLAAAISVNLPEPASTFAVG